MNHRSRLISISVALALASIVLTSMIAGSSAYARGPDIVSMRVNHVPRLQTLAARVGRVYHEQSGRFRAGGLSIRFSLCDDGPPSSARRFGLLRLEHRWGDRFYTWLTVREQARLITWEVRFEKTECVAAIPWSSALPADLPYVRRYPCYVVRLRVRDPGGKWSNTLSDVVKKCRG
jgi:hypothetical protein